MTENVYRRKNRKHSTINALTKAQQIAFAPLTFQAISAMLELGILESLSQKAQSTKELQKSLNLDEYTVNTLLEVGEVTSVLEKSDSDIFTLSQIGKAFLYDEMTKVNFNFVKDICYLGASEMTSSFKNKKPEGLNKFLEKSETIYPLLPTLPEKMRKSWYEFDHYYSDNSFDIIYKIISNENPDKIFDIGGNTGRFEKTCLKYNPKIDITMLDLPENIDVVKKDPALRDCKFYPINVLDTTQNFPKMSGAILMSQFLDCFSKEQIISILSRISKSIEPNTKIYILEPFTDNQQYEGAKYSLIHTSLYFTCMANGCSKMYTLSEMEEMVNLAGLRISNSYEKIGAHDYTLLECTK